MGLFSRLFGKKDYSQGSYNNAPYRTSGAPQGNSFSSQGNPFANQGFDSHESEKTVASWGPVASDDDDGEATVSIWGNSSNVVKPHLISLSDIENPSRTFTVTINKEVFIGRDSTTCDVVVDYDRFISRKHAKIGRDGGDYFIEDLGSSNGTFVGDRQVTDCAIDIFTGDIIKVGHTSFTFKVIE